MSPKKYSKKKLYAILKEKKGICISDYIRIDSQKLLIRCRKGHSWKAFPEEIINGKWCLYCDTKKQRRKRIMKRIHDIEAAMGGKCLTNPIINLSQEMEWECGNGHRWKSAPLKISMAYPCIKCKESSNTRRLLNVIEKNKGKLLSNIYSGNSPEIKVKCAKGHEWETTVYLILDGSWCPQCRKTSEKKQNVLKKNPKRK